MRFECSYSNPQEISVGSSTAVQFASSSCEAASSSVVSVYNGFSYGEVLQVVFLFLIFGVVAYSFLFHWLRGYRVKN